MTIAEGLSTLKAGFEIATSINQRLKEGKSFPNEIAGLLLQLQQSIIDSRRALVDAGDEIRVLKEQLASQNRGEEISKDLEWVEDGGFWIRKSEKQNQTTIVYCPLCWGDGQKLIPLNSGNGTGHYSCPIHKSGHSTKRYQQHIANIRQGVNQYNPYG